MPTKNEKTQIAAFAFAENTQVTTKKTKTGVMAIIKFETPAHPHDLALLISHSGEPMEVIFNKRQGGLFNETGEGE